MTRWNRSWARPALALVAGIAAGFIPTAPARAGILAVGFEDNAEVRLYDTTDGSLLATLDTTTYNANANHVRSVAFDPDTGNLYIAHDGGDNANSVSILHSGTWSKTGDFGGSTVWYDMEVLSSNEVYLIPQNHGISMYDGSSLSSLADAPAHYFTKGIAVDGNTVWINGSYDGAHWDTYNRTTQVYSDRVVEDSNLGSFGAEFSNGYLWVGDGDLNTHHVFQYNADGTFKQTWNIKDQLSNGATSWSSVVDIDGDELGNTYFADPVRGQILKLDSEGTFTVFIDNLPGGKGGVDGRPISLAYYVPEPASVALLGMGAMMVGLRRRRD